MKRYALVTLALAAALAFFPWSSPVAQTPSWEDCPSGSSRGVVRPGETACFSPTSTGALPFLDVGQCQYVTWHYRRRDATGGSLVPQWCDAKSVSECENDRWLDSAGTATSTLDGNCDTMTCFVTGAPTGNGFVTGSLTYVDGAPRVMLRCGPALRPSFL